MTDPVDLDRLEQLLTAASPGPWDVAPYWLYPPDPGEKPDCHLSMGRGPVEILDGDDGDLIVALRNNAEALIAEVRQLREDTAQNRLVGQHSDSPHGYTTMTITLERLPGLSIDSFLDQVADMAFGLVENPQEGQPDLAECYVSARGHTCLFYETEGNERHD